MKQVNNREELATLGHGTVVVLGPQSVVEDESGALAIQNIDGSWYAVGLRGALAVDVIGGPESWPASVVFTP